jgi:hypothetical protein
MMSFFNQKLWKVLPVALTVLTVGCASNGGLEDDNFDLDESELPPLASLSIDQIVASSKRCNAEVTKLWEARSSIPKNRVREFHLYMGKTSEACTRLQHYVNELRKAGLADKYYQQNLQMTRSIVSGSSASAAETPLFSDIENAPMMKPRQSKARQKPKPAPAKIAEVMEADDPMAELNPHLPMAENAEESFDPSFDEE